MGQKENLNGDHRWIDFSFHQTGDFWYSFLTPPGKKVTDEDMGCWMFLAYFEEFVSG